MSTNISPHERKQHRNKIDLIIPEVNGKSQVKWKDVKDFFSFNKLDLPLNDAGL